MSVFGSYLRKVREHKQRSDRSFTLRGLAAKADISPTYLSRIETGDLPPPQDDVLLRLALALGEDLDVLFGVAGRVSPEIQEVIAARPKTFAAMIRKFKDAPDDILQALTDAVVTVPDGKW